MAEDRIFENQGLMAGNYGDTPFEDAVSSILSVTLADILFEKTADQSIWFSGQLTVTFRIDNTNGADLLDTITITDSLDKTRFLYVDDSEIVQFINGGVTSTLVRGQDYTATCVRNTPDTAHDLLTISFLAGGAAEIIPVGAIVTISFRGDKVPG